MGKGDVVVPAPSKVRRGHQVLWHWRLGISRDMGTNYVPLMCYYDGELEHATRNPIYVGGHMKADRISKDVSFPEFVLKMNALCKSSPKETTINIKCRYLLDQHTSIAMHVDDESSLNIIMDLYPHHCNAIVAYIEKQSAQKSITTTQSNHPSDILPRSDNAEAAGEVFNRTVIGSTSDIVPHDDLLNCVGIQHISVHRHETASSSLSAVPLHDMVSIPADRNATKNNSASGRFDDIESIAIDMCSSASNVPSSSPKCDALEYLSEEILDIDPGPELQGSGSQGDCTMRAAITNEQLVQFVGQSSKDNLKKPVEEDIMSAVARSNLPDGVHSRKMRKNLSSDSKRIRRGFLQGSECIRSIWKLFNFHFISKRFGKPILDPQSAWLRRWNKICFLSCGIAVTLDALFFYTPVLDVKKNCLGLDKKLMIVTCVMRSFNDIFYILHIIFQFRTGFIAPSSRVFGRGELVKDLSAIAKRYLSSYFLIDILAVLPLPQVVILIGIPRLRGSLDLKMKYFLKYAVLFQYFPRFIRMSPLYKMVKKSVAGSVINFFLYMLASHIFGAFWYYLSVERENVCWQDACKITTECDISSLYCGGHNAEGDNAFLHDFCPFIEPNATRFDFGIYLDLLQSGVMESRFLPQKLFYCFWWGLQNLGSLGQNLKISAYIWEICFALSICFFGLLLFTLLIVYVQSYLQSNTLRSDEMRVKLRDIEQWMSHRMLPQDLKERIRRYELYKWEKTGGVDEETLLCNLPKDLRRDVKRHLCLALIMRVPLFERMDEQLLDAMCDRLKPALYTKYSYIIREGDQVDEMLFIMRGKLDSVTTNFGRSGFFNCALLKAGDFCGEELLTWALDPHPSNLPSSTRTVRALTEVEAFALVANDLEVVASQFRRLHSKQLRHTFRFYSQQWRTWAACYIQAAWRRYCRKKMVEESLREEKARLNALAKSAGSLRSLGATIYASRFAANALRAIRRKGTHKSRL